MSPWLIGEDNLKPKPNPNPNTEPNTEKRNLRELSGVELQNSQNPPFRVRQPNQLYHMANLLQTTQFSLPFIA